MQKINFRDYPNTTTPVSASNLNALQSNVETELNTQSAAITSLQTHEYIVATRNTTQTVSSTTTISLNTIARKNGNFTLSSGSVKIGAGINHVRVSGSIFLNDWPGGTNYLWTIIRKNSEDISTGINGSTSSFISGSVPTTIIDVQQNDLINLMADSPSGGTLRPNAGNTWLCVEKID